MILTRVLLVRHGQTEANIKNYYMGWSEEDLNQTGYKQVHLLAARLSRLPVKAVYSSPLKRAFNTATIIAEPHKVEVVTMDKLKEINLGEWQGLYAEDIMHRWPDLWKQSRTDPSDLTLPGGESYAQVVNRAIAAFEQILADNLGKHVVLVTHDVVIRVLAAYTLGVSNSIYRRMTIGNASISTVSIIDGKRYLILLNDTAHLDQI
ncbi:MAG: histidine phosphatase family protein [Chloroflexi bacterium]|nr:histidine phosphatase family protein [Chloroflexota bacterium]